MFCNECGTHLNEGAAFCPNCGAQAPLQTEATANQPPEGQPFAAQPQAGQPVGGFAPQAQPQMHAGAGALNANDLKGYLAKGIEVVCAAIFAIMALVALGRIVNTLESTIGMFSSFDGVLTAVGVVAFIVVGLLLAAIAALAALPLIRSLMDAGLDAAGCVDRSIVFGIVLLVVCVALWICKLIFQDFSGGDISYVLYRIFGVFGITATNFFAPTVVALVALYITRVRLFGNSSYAG